MKRKILTKTPADVWSILQEGFDQGLPLVYVYVFLQWHFDGKRVKIKLIKEIHIRWKLIFYGLPDRYADWQGSGDILSEA